MLLNEVITAIEKRQKGSFTRICWRKNIESANARKLGMLVEKETTMTVRVGIVYERTKRAKLKEAERTTPKQERAPWYKHREGTPYILESLKDPSKTYIQLYPVPKKNLVKVKYYINGIEKTKAEVQNSGYVNASTFNGKDEELIVMSVATDNIISIADKKIRKPKKAKSK